MKLRFFIPLCLCMFASLHLEAALQPATAADLAAATHTINFDSVISGTEVNGLSVDGVLFQVTLAGVPTNGLMVVDGGPGVTNNVAPPNLLSLTNPPELALSIALPELANVFGYGYAILAFGTVPAATSIEFFAGANPLGTISFTGTPDPVFTGGLAAVKSDELFDRVVVTFSPDANAFALDNIRFGNSTIPSVPESGSTAILLASATLILFASARRDPRQRLAA